MLVKIPELAIGKFKIYTMSVLGGNRRILGEGRVLVFRDVLGMAGVTQDS